MDTVCRLCLSRNANLIYIFEPKGTQGWTAADGILEFLRIQVSADDIYPQCVCIDCMGKLEDFKEFKERCESNKEWLERVYAGEREIERDEIQESEDLIPKMISFGPGKVITPDHILLLQPKMESDLSPPFTIIGDSLIASEDEMELHEEEERDPLGNLTDVEPAMTQQNGSFSAVKEELCGEGSTHELAVEVVTLSRLPGSVDTSEVKEECSNPSGSHNLDILTFESRSTDKEPLPSSSGSCKLHSTRLHLGQLRMECRFTALPAEPPRHENTNRKEHPFDRGESSRSSFIPSHTNNPQVLSSPTTTFVKEQHGMGCYILSPLTMTKEAGSGHKKYSEEVSLWAGGDVGEKPNISSNMRVLEEWVCKVCQNKFEDTRSLRMHQRIHSGETLFKCAECGKTFSEKSTLREHLMSHDRKGQFRCAVCLKRFSHKSTLKTHLRIHPRVEFSLISSLKESKGIRTQEKPFKCKQCDEKFTSSSGLMAHIKVHMELKPFECAMCHKQFRSCQILKRHKKIHTAEKPFECAQCDKRFIDISRLNRHVIVHTEVRPFACEVCNKRFRKRGNLERHTRIHTGETPYKCETCNRRFRNSGNLKKHIRTHTKEKPFECGICHKVFRVSGSLNKHLRIHSGEKPFECGTCSKQFSLALRLKKHLRIHSGLKPFECAICSKRFLHSGSLKAHQVTHTGEKNFHCEVCDKDFGRSCNLDRHLLTHSGEEPFECEWCNRRFSLSNNLNRHLRTHT